MNSYILFALEFDGRYHSVIWHLNDFYVSLKPIVQRLGLKWDRQARKVRNGAYGFHWCIVEDKRLDGSVNETLCIHLSHLGAYLKSIELNSVPPQMRDRLAKYQCECAKTMIRALNSPNLDGVEAILTSMDYTLFRDAAVQQHWNAEAMRKLGVCIGG